MTSTKSAFHKAAWLCASLAFILFTISVLDSVSHGGKGIISNQDGQLAEPIPVIRRQADNSTTSDTTSAASTISTDSTTSQAASTTSVVVSTTQASSTPASTDSGTTPSSDPSSSSSSSGGGDSSNTPASTAAGSSGGDSTSSQGTTTVAAAAPAATTKSSSDSNSNGSGSNPGSSSGNSGSSQPASSGNGDSSNNGNSNDGGSSDQGAQSQAAVAVGGSTDVVAPGPTAKIGSATLSVGGSATKIGDQEVSLASGGVVVGPSTHSFSNAPAQTEAPITSIGKPTTLPTQKRVTSEETVFTTTGKDGKTTPVTKHFRTTIVTAPVVTPSTVITPTSSGPASTSSAQGDKKSSSAGLSTGGKAAVGVLVPLVAIAGAAGIAWFLIRHRKEGDDDDFEARRNISGPIPVEGVNDPRNRFSNMPVMDSENPENEPINKPTLPALRTPQMSIVGGPESLMKTGPAARAGAAIMAGLGAQRSAPTRAAPPTTAAAPPLARGESVKSTVSSISAYSRYSDEERSGLSSSPPPLPEIPQQHTNFLDPPTFGTGIGFAEASSHPFDPPEKDRNLSAADGSSRKPNPSDHPSQSASKSPSNGPSRSASAKSTGLPDNIRRLSDVSSLSDEDEDMKHLSTVSAISDAPVADARATQLYYPFGETVMTPGGRIVPRPIGPNPNNINPGLGGMRPDGSHSAKARAALAAAGHNTNGYSNVPAPPPKLPQVAMTRGLSHVPEQDEDEEAMNHHRASSPTTAMGMTSNGAPILPAVEQDTGFSFDFGSTSPRNSWGKRMSWGRRNSVSPTGVRPSTSPEPVRTDISSPSPPPVPPNIPVERSAPGSRPRAPSAGYRQYRANNL